MKRIKTTPDEVRAALNNDFPEWNDAGENNIIRSIALPKFVMDTACKLELSNVQLASTLAGDGEAKKTNRLKKFIDTGIINIRSIASICTTLSITIIEVIQVLKKEREDVIKNWETQRPPDQLPYIINDPDTTDTTMHMFPFSVLVRHSISLPLTVKTREEAITYAVTRAKNIGETVTLVFSNKAFAHCNHDGRVEIIESIPFIDKELQIKTRQDLLIDG